MRMDKNFGRTIINWLFSNSDERRMMGYNILSLKKSKDELLNVVSNLEKEIRTLKENQVNNESEQKKLSMFVNEYTNRFGAISNTNNFASDVVRMEDEDANIFHHLVSLNGGNEFNKEQVNAIR